MRATDRKPTGNENLEERLQALLPTITQLCKTTGAASVSFGVIHNGEIILQGADGWRDAIKKKPADINTAYVIGSTMKAMIASCCGLLVEEQKLGWDDKLSKYLPFRSVSDPVIGEQATVRDALSHSTGVAQLDLSWYGASGKNLVDPSDVLHVVAHLPIDVPFRSGWSYCNYLYVIMARVIDKISGCNWKTFLRQRILEPLGMDRSRFSRDDFDDDNVAEPHYVKDDGSPGALPRPDLSADTLMGPAGCLWSTVPDMLKWVKEVLRSINPRGESGESHTILKQMDIITAHQSLLSHEGLFENSYGFGWSRLSMPSSMYGFMSTNGMMGSPLLGEESGRRLMLYHGGQVTGYLATLCLFPETQSAIVAFSNAQALGDASDWAARAIMQELFELRPVVDLVSQAQIKAKEAKRMYSDLMDAYEKNRGSAPNLEDLDDKFGEYCNEGLKLSLKVRLTTRKDKAGEFLVNDLKTQQHYLEPFQGSVFGFPPASREEQESRCMVDYVSYEQFLLRFVRNESGNFDSVSWIMQPGLEPVVFKRK